MHEGSEQHSLVDYNRAGVPLLEIVSEPDMASGAAAAAYGAEVRRIVRFLGISDGNMQVRKTCARSGALCSSEAGVLVPVGAASWRQQCSNWANGHAEACALGVKRQTVCRQLCAG